jgi:pimeloyl-ACP methyl ester carboxylesterase
LVHGIWGSGNPGKPDEPNPNYTWKEFIPLLNKKNQYKIFVVDYSKYNAASFDDANIRENLINTVEKALDEMRDQAIVGSRVDVVAHSMGGLVVRSFCKDNPDACKKSIRKLITIDTPHYGSELADWPLLHEKHPEVFYALPLVPSTLSEKKRTHCSNQIRTFVDGGPIRLFGISVDEVNPLFSPPPRCCRGLRWIQEECLLENFPMGVILIKFVLQKQSVLQLWANFLMALNGKYPILRGLFMRICSWRHLERVHTAKERLDPR